MIPKTSIEKLNISNKLIPQVVWDQFEWRKTKIFKNKNWVAIGDVSEPLWWNRPLKSDLLIKKEENGLWSLNLPYIFEKPDYKTGYNILVGINSIPVCIHLKIDLTWPKNKLSKFNTLILDTVYTTLLDLGVDPKVLSFSKNDLLCNGKKFLGEEHIITNGVYSADAIITLEYTPEQELFKKLTGKYALARGITGIIEETKCFTKEQFMIKLSENFDKFFEELNN